MTRVLKSFLPLIAAIAFSHTAFAATDPASAKNFVDTVASQVLAIVKDDQTPKEDKEKKIEGVFTDKVDVNFVAKFVLGKHWREASPEQQQAYMDAYKPFILKNYANKLTKYSGQTYTLRNPRAGDNGAAVVTMDIVDPDGQKVTVDYSLRDEGNGAFKIVDITVEGVSLLTTQRSEFDSIVQSKGVDGLIEALKKQVAAKV
jgi:phospholipid transport system substrate-binding protein